MGEASFEPRPGRAAAGAPEERARRGRTTGLLVALRLAYAYNWFDIGPALPRIGASFGVGPAGWGLLAAAFLVGAGTSQVPAGLLARRLGERPVAIGGAAILAVTAIAGAFAPGFPELLASRIVAGVGAGLFFSPAIGWVGRLFGPGERGIPVGGFSSAFSAGAAAGVAGAALLVPVVGWRENLVLGGVALALVTVATWLLTRPRGRATVTSPGPLGTAWRGRSVLALGLAFVGFEGATFATGQFVVPYGESVRLWPSWLAGAVGASFILASVVGGPVGGWIAERSARHRLQLVGVTLIGAAGLAALPIAGVAAALAIGSAFSFAYGFAYAVMYVLPHYWAELPAGEIPLAIGLLNAIQLAGGAGVAALFGWLVAARSYPFAWEYLAAAQLATLVALLGLRATRSVHRPAEAGTDRS